MRKVLLAFAMLSTLGGCVVAEPVVMRPAPYYPPPPPAYYYPPPAYYGPPALGFSFNYRSGPGYRGHHHGYRRW